ncbi:hypothetical protein [Ghiorsea bivora]|uniref:hypothetical protein n=1 Tax=Ghiorsea bivora TaxID=1485545 RepID=UPI00057164B1|nr:hypothetical protein [Ghiorsea bivora]
MKKLMILLTILAAITACSEEERPAAQAKHALDAAQQAADQATQHAQDMADKAQEMLDNQ